MSYPWQTDIPYNDYSSYIKRIWGRRVQKISVDAGLTCPNRDGTLGREGCGYCTVASFVPSYCQTGHSLAEQMREGMEFFARKYAGQGYLVYFQANSNTYTDPGSLRDLMEQALDQPGVVGLVIGTRPDTLPDSMVEVLAGFARRTYLNVEIGIESTLDRSLARIGRGHDFAAVVDACDRLHGAGVGLGGHIILGLPGESFEAMLGHATRLNQLPLGTLKIHHLQILEGTRWAAEWRVDPTGFQPLALDEYLELVIRFLELLKPGLVIERLCNESPEAMLLAPRWGGVKNFVLTHMVVERLRREGRWQGRLCGLIDNY